MDTNLAESRSPLTWTDKFIIGACLYGALVLFAVCAAMLETLFASGGHTGSEMALLAHNMDMRSGGSLLLLGLGSVAIWRGLFNPARKPLYFAIGVVLGILAAVAVTSVFLDLTALETADRCGTYDTCY